jgi:hypothetical protein
MPLPPKLQAELAGLAAGYVVQVIEEPACINLIFSNFPVGTGFNADTTDVLLKIPRAYPDTGPDMFWTRPTLLLKNGQPPRAAEVLETHVGNQWRRFSWHPGRWNPVHDGLSTYLEFVKERFTKSL